jgi:hypothetical protein
MVLKIAHQVERTSCSRVPQRPDGDPRPSQKNSHGPLPRRSPIYRSRGLSGSSEHSRPKQRTDTAVALDGGNRTVDATQSTSRGTRKLR